MEWQHIPPAPGKPALARGVLEDAAVRPPRCRRRRRSETDARERPRDRAFRVPPAGRARRATRPPASAPTPRAGRFAASAATSYRRSSSAARSSRRRGGWSPRTACRHAGRRIAWKTPQPSSRGPSVRHRWRSSSPAEQEQSLAWCRRAPGRRLLDLDLAGAETRPCAAGAADHGQPVRPTRPLRAFSQGPMRG